MHGKELIRDIINTYFMLVTMIVGAMMVLGTYFMPDVRFGYEAFGTPLRYAAFGTLPNLVMYSKRELTMKQFLIRKIIQLILVEVIVIAVALPIEMFEGGKTEIVLALAFSVFVIYLLTHLIDWFQNCAAAKQMTEELLIFQQKHEWSEEGSNYESNHT